MGIRIVPWEAQCNGSNVRKYGAACTTTLVVHQHLHRRQFSGRRHRRLWFNPFNHLQHPLRHLWFNPSRLLALTIAMQGSPIGQKDGQSARNSIVAERLTKDARARPLLHLAQWERLLCPTTAMQATTTATTACRSSGRWGSSLGVASTCNVDVPRQ